MQVYELSLEFARAFNQDAAVAPTSPFMKRLFSRIALGALLAITAHGQEVPALLKGFLTLDKPVRAEAVVVLPPPEIEKYIAKVEQAAQKDRKWFEEYSKNTKPGIPLPFHEKIGLTKTEYDEYLALWAKREFKVAQVVNLLLRKGSEGRWNIIASDAAASISSLRYSDKDDNWKSTNGMMTRLPDINADPMSILGAWTGKEWKFEEETSLSKLKENFAVGTTVDGKYHLLVYRAQEMTATGTRLLDKNLVLRIPAAAGAIKTTAPTKPATPSKPATPGKAIKR